MAHADEPFRPEAGKFPPLEKAHAYRGELVFVDHANRRGSLRVAGVGQFRRNDPHPFAMLPYGMVRYHGAPADLRDIPLGTVLHVRAFLPPDPKTSAVPVLPVNNKDKDANHNRGAGIFPAENHVLLLEDEPSHCQRKGLVWKLKEVEIKNREGTIIARRESKQGGAGKADEETLSFDAATRIWRGRESLRIEHLITEGAWPAEGKKALNGQIVMLGITWKPTLGGVFTRFHISDIWLDDDAMQNSAQHQTEVHKAFMRSRWLPAWVDAVEYGKFGRATVTATLFGGMDASLYADFKPGITALMNGVENTLKHTEGGSAGPTQMAARGKLIEVRGSSFPPQIQGGPQISSETKSDSEKKSAGLPESVGNLNSANVPLGSSGIQIRFETDLITEGMRPTRIVKVRPASWPDVHLPREEHLGNGASDIDERFPKPDIFPKY
ncbi:MAG TPA: hypothetical protein DIT13_15450 [Verrucomicrobiales bacterium]|nr:hypothetical protein [Verrucomicrobiales bacterium]HRJ09988.1 hypothetical protein [Prosthecobacter sp.]HRK12880.1 hypothetical protein [Prosthecobacter sp.]